MPDTVSAGDNSDAFTLHSGSEEVTVMLDLVPSTEQITTLVGKPLYEIWTQLCALIDENYDMERLWGSGGKAWNDEYKYRRGGKTLCALYARESCGAV